ncbi:MAG: 50S ribosomal protein L16 [Candidatus Gottesmanbacteria bacterium]|nr:50S ribosomal protein L16 [Candidatus Gottesmanbacteria bacterium]
MLAPRRAKHRKAFRGKRTGISIRGSHVDFGEYGLKALTAGWVTSRQIEAARRALTHSTRRGGRIWIRIFPDKPVTHKPPETRMGSGKGDVFEYVAVVRPGRILFEMAGISHEQAVESLRLAAAKLPVRTLFVAKD